MFASDPLGVPASSRKKGLRRIRSAQNGIVYTVVRDDGSRKPAQKQSARREMAGESAAKVFRR